MDARVTGTNFKRNIIWFALLLIPAIGRAASVLPTGQPEYDFLYDRWHREETIQFGRFDYQLGPYVDRNQSFSYGPFDFLQHMESHQAQLFGFVAEDASSSKLTHPTGYESYRGGFAAGPSDRLFIYGNFVLDQRKAEDPYYTGKKWRGLAGGVEQAFVSYQTKSIDVLFGRFASFWGPRESLVLAATNDLDGFSYRIRWGRLTFSYQLARLDGQNSLTDSGAVFENRYFAGHRLDIHAADNLRFGLFETIIFAGAGRTLELNYLNPLLFFHAEQLNDNINDNTFLGFDFSYSPIERVRLFGQLLVDDFQIEKKSQGDQEPNEYGLLAGGEFIDALPQTDIRLQYTRVTNRTFNQPLTRNRYEYHHTLLGAADGNDYDLIATELSRWFGDNRKGSVELTYRRQGEGKVNDSWTTPWLDIEGSYHEPFPTGVVEKTFTVSAGFTGFVGRHLFVRSSAGYMHISNFNHQTDNTQNSAFVHLRLSTFFNAPLSIN